MVAKANTAMEMVLTVPDDATVSGFTRLRCYSAEGVQWWVASDVGAVMGIKKVRNTLAGFPDDEKGAHSLGTPGGRQTVLSVNEAGLWRLIIKSRVPAADRFKRWLVWDVLPSIRKHGCYPPPKIVPVEKPPPKCDWVDVVRTLADSQSEISQAVISVERKVDAVAERVEVLGVGMASLMQRPIEVREVPVPAPAPAPALPAPNPTPVVRWAKRKQVEAVIVAELKGNPRRTDGHLVVVLHRDHQFSADRTTGARYRKMLEQDGTIPLTPKREAVNGRWMRVEYGPDAGKDGGLDDSCPQDRKS